MFKLILLHLIFYIVGAQEWEQRRELIHVDLKSSQVFGNSTDLQYFYTNVYLGSQAQKQAVIVDTGSSIAAVPCDGYCHRTGSRASCGKHINSWYEFDKSTAGSKIDCHKVSGCTCIEGNKCQFYQGYLEGSSYSGFMVKDQIYFGDNYRKYHDNFMFGFGCVNKETNLFYDQAADGILGMGMSHNLDFNGQKPIYEAMFDAGIIPKKMFNICLGKNGGFFQFGGYQQDLLLENVRWVKMAYPSGSSYKFNVNGVSVNSHMIKGSEKWSIGFVDSGTTFSYFPTEMFNQLMIHFDYFCNMTKDIKMENGEKRYCKGDRYMVRAQGETLACFMFDSYKYQGRDKEFLLGYPVINFYATDVNGEKFPIKWYPSEYLYKYNDGQKYCLTADTTRNAHEILFGSTLMRQNDYVFDIDNKKIGIGRAKCSIDPNMIVSEQDYVDYGNTYGLVVPNKVEEEHKTGEKDANVTLVQDDKDYEDCDHQGKKSQNKFTNSYYSGKTSSYNGSHNTEKSFLSKILSMLGGLALVIFSAVVILFFKELFCIIRQKMMGGPKTDETKLIKYQFDNESSGINNELQQHRLSNEELKQTQDDESSGEYDSESSSEDEGEPEEDQENAPKQNRDNLYEMSQLPGTDRQNQNALYKS